MLPVDANVSRAWNRQGIYTHRLSTNELRESAILAGADVYNSHRRRTGIRHISQPGSRVRLQNSSRPPGALVQSPVVNCIALEGNKQHIVFGEDDFTLPGAFAGVRAPLDPVAEAARLRRCL